MEGTQMGNRSANPGPFKKANDATKQGGGGVGPGEYPSPAANHEVNLGSRAGTSALAMNKSSDRS